jgi:hypothetical protein
MTAGASGRSIANVSEAKPPFEPWNPGAESQTRAEVIVPASPMTVEGLIEAERRMAQFAKHGTGWRRGVAFGSVLASLLCIGFGVVMTLLFVVARL